MDGGSRDAFDRRGTIGIEEEFYVVDERGIPTSGTDELCYESDPPAILEDRLDHELFKCVIETQTPVIESLAEAPRVLAEVRDALVEHASRHGYRIAGAGLHPLASWRTLEHAEKPRYRRQLERIQYPQHRNTTAGLHVHVGVDDADMAVWIANELRGSLPAILALAANSPYWNGYDTGLASARSRIFAALPNTGMPSAFSDFETYLTFERRLIETGAIDDRGEVWYDVRPHTALGTVEVRVPDAQASQERVLAIVEYVHALVTELAEAYEDGAERGDYRHELLEQNKWNALRYGHEATLVDPRISGSVDAGECGSETIGEFVDREADRLGVEGLRQLYESESGAERQRRIRRADGIEALCRDLLLG